jgi:deazaflavin-dependent oxidoreductase (nitroreductase family)
MSTIVSCPHRQAQSRPARRSVADLRILCGADADRALCWTGDRGHSRAGRIPGSIIATLSQVSCGAKSGQPRTTPLLYTPHDKGFIVVASRAGAAHHPAWYHNIRAHPDAVAVELAGQRIAVRPRVVEEPERSELWQRVNDNYNGYETYEQRASGRIIPIVLLEPI